MNRGKLNNPKPGGGIDDFIERLNKSLGRLLGKKNNDKQRPPTSNMSFALIIIASSLILWLGTGFYFLNENEYGIILVNGRVLKVNKGLKLGLNFPYPFGNVEIIDGAPSQPLNIQPLAENSKGFVILDKNLLPVVIAGKFSYSITNPKLLYQNHWQNQNNFNNEVIWQVQSKVKNIAANNDFSTLKKTNLTIFSNDLHGVLNPQLAAIGITLTKFDITEIRVLNTTWNESGSLTKIQEDARPLAIRLQDEAHRYYTASVANANENLVQFDQLLPKYRQQPEQTVKRMYQDSLNKISLANTDNYPLLFLNLRQLKQIESGVTPAMQNNDIRDPIRDVDRNRTRRQMD